MWKADNFEWSNKIATPSKPWSYGCRSTTNSMLTPLGARYDLTRGESWRRGSRSYKCKLYYVFSPARISIYLKYGGTTVHVWAKDSSEWRSHFIFRSSLPLICRERLGLRIYTMSAISRLNTSQGLPRFIIVHYCSNVSAFGTPQNGGSFPSIDYASDTRKIVLNSLYPKTSIDWQVWVSCAYLS